MFRRTGAALFFLLPMVLSSAWSMAQAYGGTLLYRSAEAGRFTPSPSVQTEVHINVTGIVARTSVRQKFVNPSDKQGNWTEATYVFPLPDGAAVDHLRMVVGERVIEGQIKERGEAKTFYQQAKQQGQRASLLEQERSNIFTTSVANIGPGERITVEIQYQETLRFDGGRFQLRFPMVVGPRYIPGVPVTVEGQGRQGTGTSADTDRVPDAARLTPPVLPPKQGLINPVSLSITLLPGFPLGAVASPSHEIIDLADGDGRHHIALKEGTAPADRDFLLIWRPAEGATPTATILSEQRDGETYALMLVMPPAQSQSDAPLPRDVTFVIDTSGSMAGTSIEQAKVALAQAPRRLFTIGIGSAPNSHLMRKAAQFGYGTFTAIVSLTEGKERLDDLFRKLERPLWTHLSLDHSGWEEQESYPPRLPDLYDGEPLMLAVKARTIPTQLSLQGRMGERRWSLPVTTARAEPTSGLSVLWAREKIASLMDDKVMGTPEEDIRRAVLAVALAHHLVSAYSSLVAVDVTPAKPIDTTLTSRILATNLPDGQEYRAIFGLPSTATDGRLRLLIGCSSLALACLGWMLLRRCTT